MWSYMSKLLSSTDFLKVCGIQQFLSKQTKQIMQVPHDCVQGSAGCPCFLKPSVTDQLLKTFELKSHFPAQVRFNVSVPSCARGTAECERLIFLPAQQLWCLIYCCVGCLGSSALQPFILPDADRLLRGAKTPHLSMGARCLAESDQCFVGFDPRVLKNKG